MPTEPEINNSLIEIKLGSYAVGPSTCVNDQLVLPAVQQYKRHVASQLIPLAQSDIARKIPDADYLISRKLDGEFTTLVYRNGQMFTINPGGTVRMGLPWFKEAKSILESANINEAMIPGELYAVNDQERRPRIHDVASMVRQPRDEADLSRVRFAVFDMISVNGELVKCPYQETWKQIANLFETGTLIHAVETVPGKSSTDIERQFQKWVEGENAEGLVVRSDAAGNFKIKPLHTLDAVVIGFTESTDDRVGMMHDLLLAIGRRDGSFQVLCRVGGGFTDDERRTMLSDLKDMVVESEYAEVNSDHVAYQMVRPEWVVEISCLDLIAQNTRGKPVNRMVLRWDTSAQAFAVIRRLPLVSVISPQFKRIRDDKTPSTSDVRIDQVSDIVPIPMSKIDASELTLAKSQLLQREVYTKQLRGETLVRKFLLWKTNKETESDGYPAFVACHSDFSPTRKTPLTREVRVSDSKTQILALFHELKEANIKKGWELHSGGASDITVESLETASTEPKTKTVKKKTAKKKAVSKKTASKKVAKPDSTTKKAKKASKKTKAAKKKN